MHVLSEGNGIAALATLIEEGSARGMSNGAVVNTPPFGEKPEAWIEKDAIYFGHVHANLLTLPMSEAEEARILSHPDVAAAIDATLPEIEEFERASARAPLLELDPASQADSTQSAMKASSASSHASAQTRLGNGSRATPDTRKFRNASKYVNVGNRDAMEFCPSKWRGLFLIAHSKKGDRITSSDQRHALYDSRRLSVAQGQVEHCDGVRDRPGPCIVGRPISLDPRPNPANIGMSSFWPDGRYVAPSETSRTRPQAAHPGHPTPTGSSSSSPVNARSSMPRSK